MKTTWKWVPVARYHISAAEEWLTKMAAKGLLFRKFWGPFAQFEVAEPKPGRRYRLEVDPDYFKLPPVQMRELYEEAGWQYAAPIWGRSFFVFWSDDPMAPEPYTDSQSRADSLEQIIKICRWEATKLSRHFTILLSFLLFDVVTLWLMDALPTELVLPALTGQLVPALYCFSGFQNLRTARRMKRWLEEGGALRDFTPPKSQLVVQSVNWFFILTACLELAILIPLFMLDHHRPLKPVEQAPQAMELLLLADVEGPGYLPEDFDLFNLPEDWHTDYSQVDWAHRNYYQRRWVPFSPTEYTIKQSGKTADGSSASMTILRYDMVFSRDVEPKLNELMEGGDYHEIDMEGADRFLVSEDGNGVCASLGRRVVQVGYLGDQDLTEWYNEVVDMLQAKK